MRAEKQLSEDRMKAELTELQAEVAQLLSNLHVPSSTSPLSASKDSNNNTNKEESDTQRSSPITGTSTIDEEDDRFPVFHMFILAVAVLSSAIALTSLFPYIGFMIIDVGVASNINEAGYYSGAIGELFSCSVTVMQVLFYTQIDLLHRGVQQAP